MGGVRKGGTDPEWSHRGNELFYADAQATWSPSKSNQPNVFNRARDIALFHVDSKWSRDSGICGIPRYRHF